jgi:predicted patatin/cPLA2 family phospholipase
MIFSSSVRLIRRGRSRALVYSGVWALLVLVAGDVGGSANNRALDLAAPPGSPTGAEHPVRALMLGRHAQDSVPGRRSDPWKLGLVIEGGGMRGVVSAGMATVLETLELLDAVDAVYGTSAGAVNGAYLLARQAAYATTIYYQEINNRHFNSRWRFLAGRHLISLDYLLGDVMERRKPLKWDAVLDSPIPLAVAVTDIEASRASLLTGFDGKEELREALRASLRIPMFAGPPVEFRGRRYLDASLFAAIPVDLAIADGCTHLLVLQTRPTGSMVRQPSKLKRVWLGRYLGKIDPRLRAQLLRRSDEYNRLTARLLESTDRPGWEPPFILSVQPNGLQVAQLEKSHRALVEGAMAGARAMELALSVPEDLESLRTLFEGPDRSE